MDTRQYFGSNPRNISNMYESQKNSELSDRRKSDNEISVNNPDNISDLNMQDGVDSKKLAKIPIT